MARKRLSDKYEVIKKAAAGGPRREISDDFKYNKKKLKHIKHILHNVSVALGTLVSAQNEFSRIKGRDISPDGLLGGLGYIMPLKDVKEALNGSIKSLSDVADSLADELTNPRWDAEDDKEVKELIKEKEEVEEKVEDVPEDTVVEEEAPAADGVTPEDVTTSAEVKTVDKTANVLASAVTKALLKFNLK